MPIRLARPDDVELLTAIEVAAEQLFVDVGIELPDGSVTDWALVHGYRAITLTTWRDVPWNGPFYRGLGFEEVAEDSLRPEMAAIRRAEEQRGLGRQYTRCVMRRQLVR